MNIYTIGFTKKSARQFFDLIRRHQIGRVIDIRLRPDGQLAGFAKGADLAFFLEALADCEYHHFDVLAPSQDLLDAYRQDKDWQQYEQRFESLMDARNVPACLDAAFFAEKRCCLLCSEDVPDHCHRRLVAERLARHWPDVQIVHLA